MVDFKAKEKHRGKVNKMVELKMKETPGKDEKVVRAEVMKELRNRRKENKKAKHADVEKIKEEVRAEMGGKDQKAIDKAVSRAVAKHYSKLKKSNTPSKILKQKADSLIVDVNSQLWCPKETAWFDAECQEEFSQIQLLAAMVDINLLKAPQNFAKIYPSECEKYFDFLAKKRFGANATDVATASEGKVKSGKKKSQLLKKLEEKRALNGDRKKTENELLKEVLAEVSETEKTLNLKNLKKVWRPIQKPWFDKECQVAYSELEEKAAAKDLDLSKNPGDFKKFRSKNKEVCKQYFALMESKRKAYNLKKTLKKENVKSEEKPISAPLPQPISNGMNKKIKFSENDDPDPAEEELNDAETNGSLETEDDVDVTIKKVDNKLKALDKKKKKKATVK